MQRTRTRSMLKKKRKQKEQNYLNNQTTLKKKTDTLTKNLKNTTFLIINLPLFRKFISPFFFGRVPCCFIPFCVILSYASRLTVGSMVMHEEDLQKKR